jgi:hypothetical protein
MRQMTNEECVRQYAAASAVHDIPALTELRHPDWKVFWPQSGELVESSQAFAEIIANYPGGAPKVEITRIVGAEDQFFVTPANTGIRVAGSGDFWWSEWRLTYPNGDVYFVIDLFELRDGLIYRETVYWASPFAAPEWRAPWVERPA